MEPKIVLGRYLPQKEHRLMEITPRSKLESEISKYLIYSILAISDIPKISGKRIIRICICFACLAASRIQILSKSRKADILICGTHNCTWALFGKANHMHMHMFCLVGSFENSDIVEIEKNLHFDAWDPRMYLGDIGA